MMKTIKSLFRLIKAILHFILAFAVFSLVIGILFPSQLQNRNFLYILFIVCWFGYHLLFLWKPDYRYILSIMIDFFYSIINTLKDLWKEERATAEECEPTSEIDSPSKVPKNDSCEHSDTEEPKESPKETKPYNITAWYGIIARSILTDCITELNVRQMKTVCLMETGDLVYGENNEKTGKIESIPPKDYWMEIVRQLEEDGLSAMMDKDRIRISWE